jgi:uncharacterized glyoxalase superfamily protein PhnB
MSEPYAPDGYPRVTPYLTISGAHIILDFLVAVFGARVIDRTEGPDGKIAHGAVRIGDSTIELAEATDRFGSMPGAIHIYVPDVDHAHKLALENGAEAIHDPMDMEYGERASAVKDTAGNHWYIATYQRG